MLSAKREQFVQEWFATGNKSEAYRKAYSTKNHTAKSIHENASKLSKNTKVLSRFQELTNAAQNRNETTVDALDATLKDAIDLAKDTGSASGMISACMALMKLHGLDADTRYKTEADRRTDEMTPTEYLKQLADLLPN